DMQEQQKELSSKLLELISKSPIRVINDTSLFYIDFNIDIKLLNKALDDFPQKSLIIVKFEGKKIRILSLSEEIDSNKLLDKLIVKYGGKGGGNPKSSQGFLENMPDDIISEIESLVFNR
ncbi:MAG: DHH family phosphoesterase, partial [Promethearchaeota archaeon]